MLVVLNGIRDSSLPLLGKWRELQLCSTFSGVHKEELCVCSYRLEVWDYTWHTNSSALEQVRSLSGVYRWASVDKQTYMVLKWIFAVGFLIGIDKAFFKHLEEALIFTDPGPHKGPEQLLSAGGTVQQDSDFFSAVFTVSCHGGWGTDT